jgi:hypothetical protein
MLSSVRRAIVVAGGVAVLGAVLLALMPFNDGDVRCRIAARWFRPCAARSAG